MRVLCALHSFDRQELAEVGQAHSSLIKGHLGLVDLQVRCECHAAAEFASHVMFEAAGADDGIVRTLQKAPSILFLKDHLSCTVLDSAHPSRFYQMLCVITF